MKKLNVDMQIAVPTLLLILLMVVSLLFFPMQIKPVINIILSKIVDNFGWLYIVTCLASFAFLIWIVFSKFGDIKLGDPDEKLAYSNFAWNAMVFASGVGSSAVILGFLEPLYYLKEPPFSIKAFSQEAYEFAHMYGQFHWGPSA
ncbi:MAG: hypothetical protein GX269_04375 [Clostridiales bacterium]|nr:hypothetical protein [Clostridiales bacterium]